MYPHFDVTRQIEKMLVNEYSVLQPDLTFEYSRPDLFLYKIMKNVCKFQDRITSNKLEVDIQTINFTCGI